MYQRYDVQGYYSAAVMSVCATANKRDHVPRSAC